MKYVFLIFLLGVFFFFSFKFIFSFYNYISHKHDQPAQILHWKIKENKKQKFVIQAHFSYEFEGKTYEEKRLLSHMFFNSRRAIDWIERRKNKQWVVWVKKNGQDPLLEKHFPAKFGIYTFISLLILMYFYFFQRIYKV